MNTVAFALAIATFYALMCLGWGELFRRAVGLGKGRIPIDIALGLAALIILGGVFNLIRFAGPLGLGAVAIVGIFVALLRARRAFPLAMSLRIGNLALADILVAIVVFVAVIFVSATIVPPAAMNIYDDLDKYVPHIARMLQTGTLYGSPLNALGIESPGGQPFLQGFVAAVAPYPYVNAFDALFCFGLCIALAGTLMRFSPAAAPVAAIAAAAVAIIEPQIVNVSSLYSGSALILAQCSLLANPQEIAASSSKARALAVGLITAAMIALKPTLLVIALIMICAGLVGIVLSTRSAREALNWCIAAASGVALGLFPWLALYAPYLGNVLDSPVREALVRSDGTPVDLFSASPLGWGASGRAYTLALVVPLLMSALALSRQAHLTRDERISAATLAVFSVGALAWYFFITLAFGPYFAEYDTAVRYMTPVAIAIFPASLAIGAALSGRGLRGISKLGMIASYIVLAGGAITYFLPSFAQRISQAREFHHVLAFRYTANTAHFISYYDGLMSPDEANFVSMLQQRIPPGAPVLALLNASFRLDFRRNRIYDVTQSGLYAPWARIPSVEYVIWDYGSESAWVTIPLPDATPQAGDARRFWLAREMNAAAARAVPSGILYNDGKIAVFQASGIPANWYSRP